MELIQEYITANKKPDQKVIELGVCEEIKYNADYRIELRNQAYFDSVFVQVDNVYLIKNVDYIEIHENNKSYIEFLTLDELSLYRKRVNIHYMGFKIDEEDDLPWN